MSRGCEEAVLAVRGSDAPADWQSQQWGAAAAMSVSLRTTAMCLLGKRSTEGN